MSSRDLTPLLSIYNPWWEHPLGTWRSDLPDFKRHIVADVLSDIAELQQIVSITGPRRVGKTTALRQTICALIDNQSVKPEHILYFSFDDPEVFGSENLQRVIFDRLIEYMKPDANNNIPRYFFLDEIQRLPKWELYLKKYYDLKFPVRFIVSGSASSHIFRSSQESLLGRIKDRHMLPFSFREFCLYQMRKTGFYDALRKYDGMRSLLMAGEGEAIVEQIGRLEHDLEPYQTKIREAVISYCREGGFPEVWRLSNPPRKIEYLMDQQVRKVLYEDLMTLTQYRKPENVLRFFVYLLAHPGIEINMAGVATEVGVERRVVEDNLPRLVLTDLILLVRKFTHNPLRVRQGNIKCYPLDLALRNAVLKTWDDFTSDPVIMGLYAENLVAHEICRWPQAIEVTYYREKRQEVDFVVTHGGNRYLPIEVKYRKNTDAAAGLQHFMKKFGVDFGAVITRERVCRYENRIIYLSLRYFLLAN
jgi:uncharacterized protein